MEAQARQDVVITITMRTNGMLEVSGPIDNKMLVYGMLETARDVVREHADNQRLEARERPRIVTPILPGLPRG